MRCFVGIPLSIATRAAFVAACEQVRAADPSWRSEKWVAAENLHVTLAFLGDVPAERVGSLCGAIGAELAGALAFELSFAELRPVPNSRRIRMLWGVYDDPAGACVSLVSAIARAGAGFEVVLEDRPFTAHVTLVRTRTQRRLGQLTPDVLSATANAVPPIMSVRSATLFSSTLTRSGPLYDPLATWELTT